MNTKNTASQPKVASIADDAQFQNAVHDYRRIGNDEFLQKLVAVIDSKLRAPADQAASAAAPNNTFTEWLKREIPAGTVIGDPEWWVRRIIAKIRASEGQAQTSAPCPDCHGQGTWTGSHDGYDDADCHTCDGTGKRVSQAQTSAAVEWVEPYGTYKADIFALIHKVRTGKQDIEALALGIAELLKRAAQLADSTGGVK
jgi:hypothetical protein